MDRFAKLREVLSESDQKTALELLRWAEKDEIPVVAPYLAAHLGELQPSEKGVCGLWSSDYIPLDSLLPMMVSQTRRRWKRFKVYYAPDSYLAGYIGKINEHSIDIYHRSDSMSFISWGKSDIIAIESSSSKHRDHFLWFEPKKSQFHHMGCELSDIARKRHTVITGTPYLHVMLRLQLLEMALNEDKKEDVVTTGITTSMEVRDIESFFRRNNMTEPEWFQEIYERFF